MLPDDVYVITMMMRGRRHPSDVSDDAYVIACDDDALAPPPFDDGQVIDARPGQDHTSPNRP